MGCILSSLKSKEGEEIVDVFKEATFFNSKGEFTPNIPSEKVATLVENIGKMFENSNLTK